MNYPDDWYSYETTCTTCGNRWHRSEGDECVRCEDRRYDQVADLARDVAARLGGAHPAIAERAVSERAHAYWRVCGYVPSAEELLEEWGEEGSGLRAAYDAMVVRVAAEGAT